MSTDNDKERLNTESNSSASSHPGRPDFTKEEVRGYLFKKTRDGKWQKRWFETNGCFLTYYKRQGQKLLAALNLPQVGSIRLLDDGENEAGLFTIELNEREYTIKAKTREEASYWVDALVWRQDGNVVAQKTPQVDSSQVESLTAIGDDPRGLSIDSRDTISTEATKMDELSDTNKGDEQQVKGGCAACCSIQ